MDRRVPITIVQIALNMSDATVLVTTSFRNKHMVKNNKFTRAIKDMLSETRELEYVLHFLDEQLDDCNNAAYILRTLETRLKHMQHLVEVWTEKAKE